MRSRLFDVKSKTLGKYTYKGTYDFASFMESRLDVLIFRANFVESIYKARNYILHRKCKVEGQIRVNHPGFIVKNYQMFSFNAPYDKIIKKNIRDRIKDHDCRIICIPAYLYVNFSCMLAFKMFYPTNDIVTYPFSKKPAALTLFRQIFCRL